MYTENYMRQKEVKAVTPILDSIEGYESDSPGAGAAKLRSLAIDKKILAPPDQLEREEEGEFFERLLREAVTPEEHVLVGLIEELLDRAWEFQTGKALRGELRRMFTEQGMSDRRFYAAFHSIEKRRMCV